MKKKAIITITPNRQYAKSHKNGATFTSVDLTGSTYGSASPCDTDEEVEKSIQHAINWVKREGDTYSIVDKRIKQTTLFKFAPGSTRMQDY